MGTTFRCERDTLLDALTVAGRAVAGTGATRAVLTGTRLALEGDNLQVTGSDLDLTLSVTTKVAGSGDGVAVVPARLLTEVVRAVAPGAVEFSVTGGEVAIAAGASEFRLRLIPADDYPDLGFTRLDRDGDVTADPVVTFDGSTLRDVLGQVVRAASTDESRPILTGVLIAATDDGAIRLVSTDSYRLSVRDLSRTINLGEQGKVLVPSRALGEVRRLITEKSEVKLTLAENYAHFEVESVRLTTRLISGEFPNYQGLIPTSHPNCLTVNRERLREVVKRVGLLAQDTTPVRLEMSSEALVVKAITQDVGQATESLEAKYEGEPLVVAFNQSYLIDGLEAVSGDEVTLATADPVKPALMRSVGEEGFLYLLMPVRVT